MNWLLASCNCESVCSKKTKLQVGDKMAGRHGNKGVVSTIVPVEICRSCPAAPGRYRSHPLGVPSRMNLDNWFEVALGWAGHELGLKFASPIFDGAKWEEVQDYLEKAGLDKHQIVLIDGRTGDCSTRRFQSATLYDETFSYGRR